MIGGRLYRPKFKTLGYVGPNWVKKFLVNQQRVTDLLFICTLFKSWLLAISDLYPNIFHDIWRADFIPMVQEKFNFGLVGDVKTKKKIGRGTRTCLSDWLIGGSKMWKYFVRYVVDCQRLDNVLNQTQKLAKSRKRNVQNVTWAARSFNSLRSSPTHDSVKRSWGESHSLSASR